MKKILKYLTFAFLLSVIGVGFGQSRHVIKTDAASPATKRVWLYPDYVTWWASDANVPLGIHYFGGAVGSSWPGATMLRDTANSLYYYDLPTDTTTVVFTRINTGNNSAFDQTVDVVLESYVNTYRFELWNQKLDNKTEGAFVSFSPVTTTVVSNFAATIDTSAEACTQALAQAAIDAYNNLATFEQHQYAALDVGSGQTGLDRLNYLKARYNIVTPLSSNVSPRSVATENTTTATLIIGALGVTSLAGYYFISKKKLFA